MLAHKRCTCEEINVQAWIAWHECAVGVQGMMNGGMHPHLRNQGMHTRQQQYPDMGHGHPGMMMGPQGGQGQAGMLGVRRPASHMNGGAGMHPEEPPSKRYRKVITSVSSLSPARQVVPSFYCLLSS